MILLALVLGGFLVAAGVYCWREESRHCDGDRFAGYAGLDIILQGIGCLARGIAGLFAAMV